MRALPGERAGGARAHRGDGFARQLIGALVERVPCMPTQPVPAHAMRGCERIEPLPEIDILDRLLVGRAPAVAFPLMYPSHDAVAQILAVGMDVDEARPLERIERGDRGHELHAVVGGMGLAALELLHAL